jgi:hypothetical protein
MEPIYRRSLARSTAGEECTMLPVAVRQSLVPVVALKQYTPQSVEPMKTFPPATAGDE